MLLGEELTPAMDDCCLLELITDPAGSELNWDMYSSDYGLTCAEIDWVTAFGVFRVAFRRASPMLSALHTSLHLQLSAMYCQVGTGTLYNHMQLL